MKRAGRAAALSLAALGLVVGVLASPEDDFARAMHEGMTNMTAEMERAGMSGDPDRDFLAMMIPHHAGAVEMARLELVHGRDPLVRRLAEEIIASQAAEIQAMRARLAVLEKGQDADPGGFPAIHGTRGAPPAHSNGQAGSGALGP
ncbi:hypothetical protein SVA_3108 [Sulfurifustis variabilis]|uniref:DUF305 domain-containing protein n=2 Tax=Sulfurifustis variabilis TaxID=1675686 RepID=A0A1B4V808_9GAMM|nr:hypothetical protein SVA_3108 [Sulfurifustis variabilis]